MGLKTGENPTKNLHLYDKIVKKEYKMCMMRAPIKIHKSSMPKRKQEHKSIKFDRSRLEPDPNFIDERIQKPKIEKKEGFLTSLLSQYF